MAFLWYESFYCCACVYCFLMLITMGVNFARYMHSSLLLILNVYSRHNLQLLEHELIVIDKNCVSQLSWLLCVCDFIEIKSDYMTEDTIMYMQIFLIKKESYNKNNAEILYVIIRPTCSHQVLHNIFYCHVPVTISRYPCTVYDHTNFDDSNESEKKLIIIWRVSSTTTKNAM